jgi:hypothetical protein
MLIYVKNIKKKLLRTDGRTTQNYSSEPHKKKLETSDFFNSNFFKSRHLIDLVIL